MDGYGCSSLGTQLRAWRLADISLAAQRNDCSNQREQEEEERASGTQQVQGS